jgi:hypothetical protein
MVDLQPDQVGHLRITYNRRIAEFLAAHPSLPVCWIDFQALTTAPDRAVDTLIRQLGLNPTDSERTAACASILPARSIRWMRAKNLLMRAIERPREILPYVRKRIRYLWEDSRL